MLRGLDAPACFSGRAAPPAAPRAQRWRPARHPCRRGAGRRAAAAFDRGGLERAEYEEDEDSDDDDDVPGAPRRAAAPRKRKWPVAEFDVGEHEFRPWQFDLPSVADILADPENWHTKVAPAP